MEKEREFLEKAFADTIKLCDDPTPLNMVVVKNNLSILYQMFIHADQTIEQLTKTVDGWARKHGVGVSRIHCSED
jgi:hypothetical protein